MIMLCYLADEGNPYEKKINSTAELIVVEEVLNWDV